MTCFADLEKLYGGPKQYDKYPIGECYAVMLRESELMVSFRQEICIRHDNRVVFTTIQGHSDFEVHESPREPHCGLQLPL